ncbi:MAG: GIY-YIG nuclease family protein [Bacteroidota bacterium]|nr:GIY-YIG nuclease family protein [Bacteroidota bacterium]
MAVEFMHNIYVLWSDKLQKRYVGSCRNITERLQQHNSGQSKFTKGGIPWKLIYIEKFSNNTDARKRELFLKSGVGRNWLDKNLLANK